MRLNLKELTMIVTAMAIGALAFGLQRTAETKKLTLEEYNETLPPEERIERSEPFNDSMHVTTKAVTLSRGKMIRGSLLGAIAGRIFVYVLQKRRQIKARTSS